MKYLVLLLAAAMAPMSAQAQDGGKTWATAVAERPSDGHRIVYRFIQEYVPSFDRSKYPIRVTLAWRYESSTGMPSVVERESMDKLEDLLSPQLEESALASLALVRTGDNLRQWTYYAKSEPAFRSRLDQVLRGAGSFPIEVNAEPEPSWETYERFARGVRK